MATPLTYLSHYPQHLQDQVTQLSDANKLGDWLRARYPRIHKINNDKALRDYAMTIKIST